MSKGPLELKLTESYKWTPPNTIGLNEIIIAALKCTSTNGNGPYQIKMGLQKMDL